MCHIIWIIRFCDVKFFEMSNSCKNICKVSRKFCCLNVFVEIDHRCMEKHKIPAWNTRHHTALKKKKSVLTNNKQIIRKGNLLSVVSFAGLICFKSTELIHISGWWRELHICALELHWSLWSSLSSSRWGLGVRKTSTVHQQRWDWPHLHDILQSHESYGLIVQVTVAG